MLIRKLFRTAWRYKAQFISMIIMVALGIGVFVGFNMEWYSLQEDIGDFLAETNYADYRVFNDGSFTLDDINAIKEIEGVERATRVLNVNVDVSEGKSLALFIEESYEVSTMHIVSGDEYDAESDGFWLSDKYANANGIKLGDTLTITYRNIAMSGEVVGLVKSGEFLICLADSNQIMPDYTSFGFIYATPQKIQKALGFVIYPQINIISEMDKTQMESAINKALGKTTLVLGKEEHTAYAGAMSEIEEGQTMVSILPVLFLLIGVLTMITTMHRITANEKTQIGTLKALGFKNKKILLHYTSYGFVIGVIGTVLGIALGYGIGAIVVNPNGMLGTYFDMSHWNLYLPWWTWLLLVVVVVFLTLIGFLSVKKMLKGTAADTLRPYVPQKMKSLAIEKGKLWSKLKFATKWNMRDVFRHKTRTIMTLIGVIGCMLLLVGGLGMRDTMTGFLNTINNDILKYQTRVNFVETVNNDEAIAFAQKYDGDYVATSSVQVDGDPIELEIYDVKHDLVGFKNSNNKTTTLSDDGAYICVRLSNKGYKVGDTLTFSPYGSEKNYEVTIVGILLSYQSESITMTSAYAQSAGIPYNISSAFLNVTPGEIEWQDIISGTQTQSSIMDSYEGFMSNMNTMVVVFVVIAIILGVVVLYNLGVMSYVERSRELATLKVVGFKNKHIGRILIGQNVWLTVIGILIGLPAGVGVLQLLIVMLASEYELKMTLGALTYCVSILLTFVVSLVVGIIVALKNRKINMVEALKGAE